MTVAVLMPVGLTDEWRVAAQRYVETWYRTNFPELPIYIGRCSGEWSKGAAVADALEQATIAHPDLSTLVVADADSFTFNADHLRDAIDLVDLRRAPWVVPHTHVYRLRDRETVRLHESPGATPRLGHVHRTPYTGPHGGGITVLSTDAWRTVDGIDPRFLGWGGEDVAFGWALETLVGEPARLAARLVHLWHPHPAPDLRGSPASEELVAAYRSARGVPRRMRDVRAHGYWLPVDPLPQPVRFRMMTRARTALRLASGDVVKFRAGIFESDDPDIVDQLRTFNIVREDRRR